MVSSIVCPILGRPATNMVRGTTEVKSSSVVWHNWDQRVAYKYNRLNAMNTDSCALGLACCKADGICVYLKGRQRSSEGNDHHEKEIAVIKLSRLCPALPAKPKLLSPVLQINPHTAHIKLIHVLTLDYRK